MLAFSRSNKINMIFYFTTKSTTTTSIAIFASGRRRSESKAKSYVNLEYIFLLISEQNICYYLSSAQNSSTITQKVSKHPGFGKISISHLDFLLMFALKELHLTKSVISKVYFMI